jgi:hypothetical protein
MLTLALLAVAASQVTPQKLQARVTVTVLQPVRVTSESWRSSPQRIERIRTDETGRKLRLRMIEFE